MVRMDSVNSNVVIGNAKLPGRGLRTWQSILSCIGNVAAETHAYFNWAKGNPHSVFFYRGNLRDPATNALFLFAKLVCVPLLSRMRTFGQKES